MDLTAATEALYEEFKAPAPRHIDTCPCCLDKHDLGVLMQTPLRQLTESDLFSYMGSVFLTAGDVSDFKYFLPRIFELAAADPDAFLTVDITLGKLMRAEWRTWTPREQQVMEDFIDAWFDVAAARTPTPADGIYHCPEINDLLSGLVATGITLAPYLARLLETPPAIHAVYNANAQRLERKGSLQNAFWRNHPEAEAEVIAFLRSDAVEAVLLR